MFRTLYICMVAQRLRIINRKLRKKGKNMELKIEDNKRVFYQWDTGHKLVAENAEGCTEVHFCRSGEETALVCPIREEGGRHIADVPNILLQEAGEIHAYLFRRMEDGSETVCSFSFGVNGRPKPEGYVYTQTQVLDYGYLARRLEKLEGEGLGEALDTYLKENPVQAGATAEEAAQIRKNAQDIKSLEDQAESFALKNEIPDLSDYYTRTQTEITIGQALKTVKVPAAVSELTNDAQFVNREDVKAIVRQELGVIENGTY